MDHPIRVATREIDHALKSVADVNPSFMTTADKAAALVELARAESQLAELRLRVVADAGDVAETTAARDVGTWSAAATRRRRADRAADLRLAEALAARTALADAVRAGAVHLDQATVITRALAALPADLDPAVVDDAEAALIAYAADFGPTELHRLGTRILDVVAPEIAEAAEARHLADLEASADRRMRLALRSCGDGTTRISGLLPDPTAARLATYLHALNNPRRENATPPLVEEGRSPVSEPPERAPYGRKAARAFGQLLESVDPSRLPVHGGDATSMFITVSLDSLRADLGTATLADPAAGDSADRITADEARRLACTANLIPAVLGTGGELLDLGRTTRLFNRAQRKALVLRDIECRAEGCHVPAPWCEAHHLRPWLAGGPTDLSNATLLCSHHHHRVHDPSYSTERMTSGDLRFHRRT